MRCISLTALAIIAAALLASCIAQKSPLNVSTSGGARIATGTVAQISKGHGNVYTNIGSDQYKPLALTPGMRVQVAFDTQAMTLLVGRTYTDVPSGTPLAVLHREGLTFAIRDGNFSATYGIEVGERFTISIARQP